MHLFTFNGIQYMARPITEINLITLREVQTYFSRKCPYILQASHFYESNMLCSVADGSVKYISPHLEIWKRLLFQALVAYYCIDCPFTVSIDDFYYYYNDCKEITLMIEPHFYPSTPISLSQYFGIIYSIVLHKTPCFPEDSEFLLAKVRKAYPNDIMRQSRMFYRFFECVSSPNSTLKDILEQELFSDFKKTELNHFSYLVKYSKTIEYPEYIQVDQYQVEEHIYYLPPYQHNHKPSLKLYRDLSLLIKECRKRNSTLFFFFTCIDILFRSSNMECRVKIILDLVDAFLNSEMAITDPKSVENTIELLKSIDGLIICSSNPYLRYKNIDELLLYYHFHIIEEDKYFEEFCCDNYVISDKHKSKCALKDFLNSSLPLPKAVSTHLH